jgi:hypothetical protein
LAPRTQRKGKSKAQKHEFTEERKRSDEDASNGIALMDTFGFLLRGVWNFFRKTDKKGLIHKSLNSRCY